AKGTPNKRQKVADDAVTPSKKAKKEVKEQGTPKEEKKVKTEVKAEEPVQIPKKDKKKKKQNKESAEPPAKKEKKEESVAEVRTEQPVQTPKKDKKKKQNKESAEPPAKKEKKEEESVAEVKSEKKQKKKDKKKNKAQPPVEEKAEDAYVPGALSALFGGAEKTGSVPKEDIFTKYADGDSGFVDVPTVISEVQKKADNPEENTRKKQRENRKKNMHDRALVDERKRTVFVGNLPKDFTRRKLEVLFAECGKIDSVRLRGTVGSKETLSKKTAFLAGKVNDNIKSIVGYVKFVSPDTVPIAIKKNGEIVEDHHIRVDGCVDIKNYDRKSTIFIGNLPFEISDDELIEWAEECIGAVEFVRVIRDRNTGFGKGVGFITFKEDASIAKALALASPVIGGNEVRLQKVMKKKDKKEMRKGDGARIEKRKQKKLDKKKGAKAGAKRPHPSSAASAAPVNPLLTPGKPTKKVQKEIKKRRKMAGPKSLMK
ncbi:hypothetical protein PMAYCL1PPCAC_20973, partial [Pristionchus mayeri]